MDSSLQDCPEESLAGFSDHIDVLLQVFDWLSEKGWSFLICGSAFHICRCCNLRLRTHANDDM